MYYIHKKTAFKALQLILTFAVISIFNQSLFSQPFTKYRLTFKDKLGSTYSPNSPLSYLSQKAIARRTKQQIPITIQDIPITPSYIQSVKNLGATILSKSKWFNTIIINTSDTNLINTIEQLPFVLNTAAIARKQKKQKREYIIPIAAKKELEQKTNNTFDYGLSFNQVSMLGGDCMHNLGYTGAGLTIAVMDAGFSAINTAAVFDSLRVNNQLVGTWDFVASEQNVEDDTHGTHVLSAMAGNLPGQLIGTAPKANYWLFRTEDDNSEYRIEEDYWAAAAEFADSVGADIINSSLGYNEFDDPSQNYAYSDMNGNRAIITRAADIAASKGMLVITSAGNEGNLSWQYVTAPADADSIIAVGAVDAQGNYASFSSIGPTFDGRVKPDVTAQGSGTIISSGSETFAASGTSFSSPLVAGMAACLWQANPQKTNLELIESIKRSATQYLNPDNYKGYGIPNFCIANSLLIGTKQDVFNKDNLVFYGPNPVIDILEYAFYSSINQIVKIKIIDVFGKILFNENALFRANSYNNLTVNDFCFFSVGVYYLQIESLDDTFTIKLLK